MKNNKGISLVEVLVTCCILSIMGGIALVNFGSSDDPIEKRQLFQSANLWIKQVQSCLLSVSSMGGWTTKRFSKGNETCSDGEIEPCQKAKPCKVGGGAHNQNIKFKQRLGWNCPVKNQGTSKNQPGCFAHFLKENGDEKWYCLAIQKEVKGKKYQVVVHFDIEKQSSKIYCGKPETAYGDVGRYCGKEDPNSYTNWNASNTSEQCEWPKASDPGPS